MRKGERVTDPGKRYYEWLRRVDGLTYGVTACLFYPLNRMLAAFYQSREGSGVLHISTMTHQPYVMTRHLRARGLHGDLLVKGEGWLLYDEKAWDFRMKRTKLPGPLRYVYEFWWAWRLYPKYRIVHSHFLQLIGSGFWELEFLKGMGKTLVFQFRGDDIRRKHLNEQLHPELNCCQECDYPESYCTDARKDRLADLARKYGDLLLVTTPDLKDFIPQAIHFPFLLPEIPGNPLAHPPAREPSERIRILHVTNHEGIDGTRHVLEAVQRLKAEGFAIDLILPKKIPFQEMLRLYGEGDLSIGKLTMGYYANAQMESMYFGLPTLCYIREVFLKEIPDCPIINVKPDNLYEKLKYYLAHRDELSEIGRKGPDFVRKHHSGPLLAKRLIEMYDQGQRPDSKTGIQRETR